LVVGAVLGEQVARDREIPRMSGVDVAVDVREVHGLGGGGAVDTQPQPRAPTLVVDH
jgi:hypothetical protein